MLLSERIFLWCFQNLFQTFVNNGLALGGALKEEGFGIYGFRLYGGPFGLIGIVEFLRIIQSLLIRCTSELGIDVFCGLRFVKNL